MTLQKIAIPGIQSSFLTLPPFATLEHAIAIMSQARESCVLIIENKKLVGIFTERDVVQCAVNKTLDKHLNLSSVMTTDLITTTLEETHDIFSLSRLLRSKRIRHLPVLDEQGQVVGIITPQSLRKLLRPEYLLRYVRAADVMSQKVVHGLPDASVMELTHKMADHCVSCTVIIDPQTSHPLGIITERDIVCFHHTGLNLYQTVARDVMSQPLSTMLPQDSLWRINQRMNKLNVRRLVIAHPTGTLAGIITQSQITKMLDPAEMYQVMGQMQEVIDRQTQEVQELNQQLQRSNAELTRLSTIDELTKVVNRRKFNAFMAHEWQRLEKLRQPLSLVMCDVDFFKIYNDTYGHSEGDECLKKVANAIRAVTRKSSDLVARYGGEEFAVVLPGTNSSGAEHVAQNILRQVQALQIPSVRSTVASYVTLSVGVATVTPSSDISFDTLIRYADKMLYAAKQQGRNTYVLKDLSVGFVSGHIPQPAHSA